MRPCFSMFKTGHGSFEMTLALPAQWLSPTLSPRPFPPRRAGKGANSRMWPCVFKGRVQRVLLTRRYGCESGFGNLCAGSLTSGLPVLKAVRLPLPSWPTPVLPINTLEVLATGRSAGTSSLQGVGHIRLLAPLPAPAGVGRGGGDRGGRTHLKAKSRETNQTKKKFDEIGWDLTQIIGGPTP